MVRHTSIAPQRHASRGEVVDRRAAHPTPGWAAFRSLLSI